MQMKKSIMAVAALIVAAMAIPGCSLNGAEAAPDSPAYADSGILLDSGLSGVAQVEGGSNFSLALKSNGDLYATGENGNGQLGTGDTVDTLEWKRVLSGVSAIAAGSSFGLAVKKDGTLWVTGNNYYGQLGTGDTTERHSWTRNTQVSNIRAVAAGRFFSMIINKTDRLYATGRNDYGQLGTGNKTDRKTFIQVYSSAMAVACGTEHSVLIDQGSKRLYVTGRNHYGQLGLNNTNDRSSWTISGPSGYFSSVACGYYHSLAVKTNGDLLATGGNSSGQLGLGHQETVLSWTRASTGKKQVFAGGSASFAKSLGPNFKVYAAGANETGQLGLGEDSDMFVLNWTNTFGPASVIASGGQNSFIVSAIDSHLMVTGYNDHGELGLGDTDRRVIWTDGLK